MRAVNVEALSPCSAAETQYVSTARTCCGSASPRQRIRNWAAAFSPFDDLALGHRRRIAARRLRDQRERRGGEAPEVDPRVVCLDVDQLPEAPLRPERREPGLEVGHRRPARLRSSRCSAGGIPGSRLLSTSRPQTCSKG